MPTQYLAQPNPVWAFLDLNALPAAGGFIYTYRADNHAIPKATYINNDPDALIPWTNPITLDSTGKQSYLGTCFPIFWADDEAYYIVITDADDVEIATFDGFPWAADNTPVVTEVSIENYIQNFQFFYNYGQIITSDPEIFGFNDLPATELNIAPDNWYFIKNNTTATDVIEFIDFNPGQTEVPGNPKAYVLYNCSIPGSSETSKKIYYKLKSVRQFSATTLNIQFYAKSTISSQLTLNMTQYFGAGGSATVTTPIATPTLTSSWTLYQYLVEVPTINAKDIGTGGDDYISLDFGMPFNNVANVAIAVPCERLGEVYVDIQEESVNVVTEQTNSSALPLPNSVNWDDGNYYLKMVAGVQTWLPCAGIKTEYGINTAPSDALLCNGLPYFQSQYYNLAQLNFPGNWGTGPQGFTTSTGGTATVTATCFSNGTVVSGSAGTTPFTYTQTNNGGAMAQGVATILCTAGSTVTPGMYFLINSPAIGAISAIEYFVYYSLNNETKDPQDTTPALSGKRAIKVVYDGTETAIQLATKTATQLNVAHFRVPDERGLFGRMPNFGATGVLPLPTQITITSAGNDSGVSFAIVGLDMNGGALSENLTGANAGTATSTNTYSAITSITPNNNTASTVEVGYSGDANGLCESQSGTAATALVIDGVLSRDPNYLTRYVMYTGGATGDNVGSQQHNQNRRHFHMVGAELEPEGAGSDIESAGGPAQQETSAEGGSQANPNNVYVNKIIYF